VALTHRKPQTYIRFISAGLLVIVLVSLLFLLINRSQVILQQWNDLSADFIKLSKAGNAVDDPAWFSRLANYDLIALRMVDNTLMASTATQMLEPSDIDHQSYQFIAPPDPVPYLFFHQNTGFSQFAAPQSLYRCPWLNNLWLNTR
jgi:hypothetical protein